MEVGNRKPQNALNITSEIVAQLLSVDKNLHISVLTYFIETTKALQKSIYQSVGHHKNLIIETVSRIQGLTTDVAIFVIPNSGYNRSLEKRLFNVATSRSKRHTIIIVDKNVTTSYLHIDDEVKKYLQDLDAEYSFYIYSTMKMIDCKSDFPEEDNTCENQDSLQSSEIEPLKNTGVKVVGKIDISKFEKPKKEISKDKKNFYVVDTNVFVDCPDIISRIGKEYPVILSAKVLDELDKLKNTLDSQGKTNVQKALKSINTNIDKRDIRLEIADLSLLPADFNKNSPDNFIFTVALKFKDENPILLTSDNGLQIKAKGLGITTITLKDFMRQSIFKK